MKFVLYLVSSFVFHTLWMCKVSKWAVNCAHAHRRLVVLWSCADQMSSYWNSNQWWKQHHLKVDSSESVSSCLKDFRLLQLYLSVLVSSKCWCVSQSCCQRAAELLCVRSMFNIPIVLDVLPSPVCMMAGGFERRSWGSRPAHRPTQSSWSWNET